MIHAFAGKNVGIKEVSDKIWLVSFMQYDLGYFDHETRRLDGVDNPSHAKMSPMSPVSARGAEKDLPGRCAIAAIRAEAMQQLSYTRHGHSTTP